MKPIIAAPSAERSTVAANLSGAASPLFRGEMLSALWDAGVAYGIDPVGMIAQSAIETNWGTFLRPDGSAGAVGPGFRNTAGIKVRDTTLVRTILAAGLGVPVSEISTDHPLCHQQFPSWESGAEAHAQHLRAYCGLMFEAPLLDPRFVWVWGKHEIRQWAELSGRWAGSSYGASIESVMDRLTGVPL